MTMPHLMNCPHGDEGWCLDCVKQEFDASEAALRAQADYYEARLAAVEAEKERAVRLAAALLWWSLDTEMPMPQRECENAELNWKIMHEIDRERMLAAVRRHIEGRE